MEYVCEQCGKKFKNKSGLGGHKWLIHNEAGKMFLESKKGKEPANKGKKLSEEERKQISEKMKAAHAAGRHPGWSHVNSNIKHRSFPESFMLEVFKNCKLTDNYTIIEKMPFSKYYLDFAFIELKLCIEVDGSQHYRTIESIQYDKERDEFLNSNGWKVYRINWQNFHNNTKNEIDELVNYIKNIDESTNNRYYTISDVSWPYKKQKYGDKATYIKEKKKEYEQSQQIYIDQILNSNINFAKFGWVGEVAKILNIKPQHVSHWMKRFMFDFYQQNCFKRK